jgi:hypothetical protein
LPKPGGRKMSIRMKNAPVPQESVFKKVMNRIRRISGNNKDILVEKNKNFRYRGRTKKDTSFSAEV